jgi:hypothetical protein
MREERRTCENGSVSDHWLEHGHETDGADLTPVFSSSVLVEGAASPPTPRWTSGWRAVVVGGGLALLATLGVVGVANAISEHGRDESRIGVAEPRAPSRAGAHHRGRALDRDDSADDRADN